MVNAGGSYWHESNRGVSIFVAIYLALFFVVICLSKFLHDRPAIAGYIPEAAMVIMVGIIAGSIISLVAGSGNSGNIAGDAAESILSFSPTVFFVVLLPPIIFNSGYHLHRDLFFRYITPVCLYACLGTALCAIVVAGILFGLTTATGMSFQPSFLELLAFGSLVSATDPVSTLAVFSAKKVDPQLFYLVFGESVINDAVGLVLFEAVAHVIEVQNVQYLNVGEEILQFLCDFLLNFFGSLVLGFFFGVAVAYFLKRVDLRSTPVWELCIYATIMYFPFVLAEICRVSGIVTVLFTGICARRYAEPNLSEKGAENADAVFRLTAHMTETFIFLELGMSVFDLFGYGGSFNAAFIAFALIACLIGRAVNIYPITFFYNLAVEEDEDEAPQQTVSQDDGLFLEGETPISDEVIPWNTAHMLWFSGLRGAVSYALVRTFPNTGNEATFIVTTMFIVLATTFILGGGTETALKFLEIPTGIDEKEYIESLKKRKLLGRWFRRFELLRLRRWVLRDYEEESKADADAADYQEHVEVTEEEHIELVEREREQALYDFGQ